MDQIVADNLNRRKNHAQISTSVCRSVLMILGFGSCLHLHLVNQYSPVGNRVDSLVHEQRQEQRSLDQLAVPERNIPWGVPDTLQQYI